MQSLIAFPLRATKVSLCFLKGSALVEHVLLGELQSRGGERLNR
jgi:hypothetical protein